MSILSAIFVVGNVGLYLLERVLPLLFGIADFIKLLRVVPAHAYILGSGRRWSSACACRLSLCNFCVLRLRARRSERRDGPQPYRVTEGPDSRPIHSEGSQPHPVLVKELESQWIGGKGTHDTVTR
jgi:hypothetical protein